MEIKQLNFAAPYLTFIDNGHLFRKPFSWLYSLIALLNLLFPIYFIFQLISNKIFTGYIFKLIVYCLSAWVIVAFAGLISFQLWWDRKEKITFSSNENAEFVATPVFSHLIQTLGEWVGTWIAIVGFCSAFLTIVFFRGDGENLRGALETIFAIPFAGNYLGIGIDIFLRPIYGFLIIVLSRFLAEQVKALSSIANNTKLNDNFKKQVSVDSI